VRIDEEHDPSLPALQVPVNWLPFNLQGNRARRALGIEFERDR